MKKIILMVLSTLALQAERCEMSFAMSGVYVYETKEGMVVDPNKYKEVTNNVSRECEVKAKLAVFELWNTEQPDDDTPKIFLIKADGTIINIADRILSTPTNIPPKENKMHMPMCTTKGENIALTPDISIHTRCAYRYNNTLAYDTADGIIVNFDTRYSKIRMLQEMSDNQCCSINMKNAIKTAKKKWYETDHTRFLVDPTGVKSVQQLVGHRPATKKWLRNSMRETIEYDANTGPTMSKEVSDFVDRTNKKVKEDKRKTVTPVVKVELFKKPIIYSYNTNGLFDHVQLNIHITSLVDDVTIEKLIVNRGNCKVNNEYIGRSNGSLYRTTVLPKKLQYGKQVKVHIIAGCTVMEAEVITDKGIFTYKWN